MLRTLFIVFLTLFILSGNAIGQEAGKQSTEKAKIGEDLAGRVGRRYPPPHQTGHADFPHPAFP